MAVRPRGLLQAAGGAGPGGRRAQAGPVTGDPVAQAGGARYCPRCGARLTARGLAGRRRPVCPRCGYAHYEQLKVGAAALVERDGRLLLLERALEPAGGVRGGRREPRPGGGARRVRGDGPAPGGSGGGGRVLLRRRSPRQRYPHRLPLPGGGGRAGRGPGGGAGRILCARRRPGAAGRRRPQPGPPRLAAQNYHLPRARLAFRRAGVGTVYTARAAFRPGWRDPYAIGREFVACYYYLLRRDWDA